MRPLTAEAWLALLEKAGLVETVSRIYPVEAQKEAGLLVGRYGIRGMFATALRAIVMYIRNPAYRAFVKGVREVGVIPDNMDKFFGYGFYVGRKV